jgi:hypothetical protein
MHGDDVQLCTSCNYADVVSLWAVRSVLCPSLSSNIVQLHAWILQASRPVRCAAVASRMSGTIARMALGVPVLLAARRAEVQPIMLYHQRAPPPPPLPLPALQPLASAVRNLIQVSRSSSHQGACASVHPNPLCLIERG